jgi:hypothetical protein
MHQPQQFALRACAYACAQACRTIDSAPVEPRGDALQVRITRRAGIGAAAGGVTAGYSHGYALDLKRELLCKWAEHVQGLVSPEGAALLR